MEFHLRFYCQIDKPAIFCHFKVSERGNSFHFPLSCKPGNIYMARLWKTIMIKSYDSKDLNKTI